MSEIELGLLRLPYSGAVFSPCRKFRYALTREWGATRGVSLSDRVAFVGLNPSTADETEDDPTIRRCIGFAKDWGFRGLVMLNIFAWRATNPAALRIVDDPKGPRNDDWIRFVANQAGQVIAAWGAHGELQGRGAIVATMIPKPYCLGTTRAGQPRHPLYLKRDTRPALYNGPC